MIIFNLTLRFMNIQTCMQFMTGHYYSNLSNNRAGANNRAQGKSSGDIVSCRQLIIVLRGIFYNFHIMYISPK